MLNVEFLGSRRNTRPTIIVSQNSVRHFLSTPLQQRSHVFCKGPNSKYSSRISKPVCTKDMKAILSTENKQTLFV